MKCGICGSCELRAAFPLNAKQVIYDCQKCEVRQLQPQKITQEDYQEAYYDYYGRGLQSDNSLERIKLLTYKRLLTSLDPYVNRGKLLDIGCGLGHAMKAARKLGWEAVGTEFSKEAADIARRYADSYVSIGDVTTLKLPKSSFDAVTLFDVIEHMPDPVLGMREIAGVLRAGGVVLIVTPNARSLSARLLSVRWNHYHHDHLFYFSPHSVRSIMPLSLVIRKIEPTVKLFNIAYIRGYFAQYSTVGLSPLSRILYAVLPRSLREFPFAVQSGSMMVIAQKTDGT